MDPQREGAVRSADQFRPQNNLALCESIEGPFNSSAELTKKKDPVSWISYSYGKNAIDSRRLNFNKIWRLRRLKFIRNVNNEPRVRQAMLESFWENLWAHAKFYSSPDFVRSADQFIDLERRSSSIPLLQLCRLVDAPSAASPKLSNPTLYKIYFEL